MLITSMVGVLSANCGGGSSSCNTGLGHDGGGAGGNAGCVYGGANYGQPICNKQDASGAGGCVYGGASYGQPGCGSGGTGGSTAGTCNNVLFDNGNTAACTTPTNTSVFTLAAASTVTSLALWINTTISGQTVTYTLLSAAGTTLSSGPTTKGSCDPYQTNWCQFVVTMNMSLPAGTYTVKSSAVATCSNSGSSNIGFVAVKGCAGSASLPDAGSRLDGGITPGLDAATTCQEAFLFKMESVQGVSYNPPVPTTFTLSSAATITRIMTYHYSATIGSKSPTIAFKNTSTSAISGPWPQVGYKSFNGTLGAPKSDPGNVAGPPDNYWLAYPGQTVPAGTYQVIDSEPTTWAYTPDLGNRGVTWVLGCSMGGSSPTMDGGTADVPSGSGTPDAPPTYLTVSTPPAAVAGPAGAKISALKTTTNFSPGGIFWKDGRLFAASNSGESIVISVMPGETGTLWANVPSLQGGTANWRHGVPLAGGSILLAIDYYGGPLGLHEISPAGTDTPWTLAQSHGGIGDIVALPNLGGWVFSDFEGYGIFKVSTKNAAETSVIPTGSPSFTPCYLAHDGSTDTLYFVNMNNLGGEPWFGGDGAIYKMTMGATTAPTLVASAPAAGTRFMGLAIGLGGLFPAGLYAADYANSRIVKVESTGALTPVITGVPTPNDIRIDPVSKGMALESADQIIFVLP